jgi:hypothetical protein
MHNYLTLLRLFVLLAIKVNDEFYLRDMLNISREKQVCVKCLRESCQLDIFTKKHTGKAYPFPKIPPKRP